MTPIVHKYISYIKYLDLFLHKPLTISNQKTICLCKYKTTSAFPGKGLTGQYSINFQTHIQFFDHVVYTCTGQFNLIKINI